MIQDLRKGFEFLWLKSLLSWTIFTITKRIKNPWHSNDTKVILPNFAKDHCFWTLWTLNYIGCISFSILILSIWLIIKPNIWRKYYSPIFERTWSNLHLCRRGPIKSVLFDCPSVCLSVGLWRIFPRIYPIDFLNVLHENNLPYILKSDNTRFWKIVFTV